MKATPLSALCVLAGASALLLSGCEMPDLNSLLGLDSLETPSLDAAISPAAPPAAPGTIAQGPGQNLACDTPNNLSWVTWSNNQPVLSFGGKASAPLVNNAPISVVNNPDGSKTYDYQGERIVYTRIFPDATCFIQVLGQGNAVVLEENGQARALAPAEVTAGIPLPKP